MDGPVDARKYGGLIGYQARMALDFKKNEVALFVLPRTWWLVAATDVGRAVLTCVRLVDRDDRVVLACVHLVEEDGRFWSTAAATRGSSCRSGGCSRTPGRSWW